MNDIKLIITSPCGQHEWQHYASFIPQIGTQVTCRGGRDLDVVFTGTVAEIHHEVRMGFGVNEGIATGGAIVSVWLD